MRDNISSAFSSVKNHKMRSILTMLGIIIGISSVITVTSLGAGVKNAVFGELSEINTSLIEVYTRNAKSPGDFLTLDDARAIENIPNVQLVLSGSQYWGNSIHLRTPGEIREGFVFGADENYRSLEKFSVISGRFFTKNDIEAKANIAFITETTAMEVFGKRDVAGEKLTINTVYGKREFTVIGVAQLKQSNIGMLNTPLSRALAFIPVTTFAEVYNQDYVDFLEVLIEDVSIADKTAKAVTDLLSIRHNNEDTYYVQNFQNSLSEVDNILNMITAFVTFVAGISLFVGGVGVMNIMLVTVKERTKEIGIRKSLGASNGTIQLQFLTEAIILTSVGGLIGILFGVLGSRLIIFIIVAYFPVHIQAVTSLQSIALSFLTASLVGIIFGVYPAAKAAKLNPIEALRYE